jgi:hypothetical protein
MSDDNISKRVFYLEQALKKAWKEMKRLKQVVSPEEFSNRPFEKLEDK